ncbi:MAG: sodium:proton antiporter [Anaerolineales bacterium]|nr:sodium:proton antiporter [Anaerolineales bacterium]
MGEEALYGFAGIVVLGVSAQWAAWRLKLPSILLLLIFGFIAGPVTNLINPDHLLGEALFPAVSLAVGIILFEGGLSLKLGEMKGAGTRGVVYWLITVGVAITWLTGTAAAYYLLSFNLATATLLGAILVVSGPTVVLPLLRFIRPVSRVSSILKWEGILIDPVGATLAVLVFEAVLNGEFSELTPWGILVGIVLTLLEGGLMGAIGAVLTVFFLERRWVPEYLQTAVVLMIVLGVFAASNSILQESGLMATTIMGVILANQKRVSVKDIVTFKEELGILLLSVLFIVLSARLKIEDITSIGVNEAIFLAILILVARPISAFVSTIRSGLPWRERLFLAWLAPRGIVAASVASLFALELSSSGVAEAERLVPITFLVVIGSVVIYALTASPLAAALGLKQMHPQGSLMVGAHSWARKLALALKEAGYEATLVDSNGANVRAARAAGLNAVQGNILSDDVLDDLEMEQIGYLLALTPNSELNALAAVHFTEILGHDNVFQLAAPRNTQTDIPQSGPGGRVLFNKNASYQTLGERFAKGNIQQIFLTERQNFAMYRERMQNRVLPLFAIDGQGNLNLIEAQEETIPQAGQALFCLVEPELEAVATPPVVAPSGG